MRYTIPLTLMVSISIVSAAAPYPMQRQTPGIPYIPVPLRLATSPNGTILPPLETVYYFNQLVDHNDIDLDTFQQRYWANWEFYEGGPIVLMTPGEVDAAAFVGYLTNASISGMIAQRLRGAVIVLEHRFFGYSNPYDNLTSQSLELLTIEQVIEDLVYFAQNVDLPFSGGKNLRPDYVPWILVGGSYAGALTKWTMESNPGVFRAGYASSAVVEAIIDFHDYFTPIREYMPQNCSADIQAVIAYFDQINAENNGDAIQNLKEAFGLGNLSHVDDFAAAYMVVQYNLFDWQLLQPNSSSYPLFYEFCDALEVKAGVSANASGWGLEHAISSWGSFWNDTYYPHLCGTADAEACLGKHDPTLSYWTNITVDNYHRSWFWIVCNQVGFFQTGPPEGQPALVSRVLQPVYFEEHQRQCVNMFPQKFSAPPTPSVEQVNTVYKGLNTIVDRLFLANGLRDPWRSATVFVGDPSKDNTTLQLIYDSDGFHCSDMLAVNGIVDDTIYAVQTAALEYMKKWVDTLIM